MRIFKREFELEIWLKKGDRFERFATYPICKWSGRLGPKVRQGDRQAPEGFYTVGGKALNPNSRWYRSFNLGFPNAHDRALRRTGSFIMVHGGCSSIGCYAMTNAPDVRDLEAREGRLGRRPAEISGAGISVPPDGRQSRQPRRHGRMATSGAA